MKNQTKEPCLFWKLGKEEPYKVSNENLLIFGDDTTWEIIAGFLFYWKFLGCSLVISNLDLLISTRLGVIGSNWEFLFYSMFLYARAVVDFCKM